MSMNTVSFFIKQASLLTVMIQIRETTCSLKGKGLFLLLGDIQKGERIFMIQKLEKPGQSGLHARFYFTVHKIPDISGYTQSLAISPGENCSTDRCHAGRAR